MSNNIEYVMNVSAKDPEHLIEQIEKMLEALKKELSQ